MNLAKTKESIAAYDVVLMRKDPPFDMNFVYTTYILEQAEREGHGSSTNRKACVTVMKNCSRPSSRIYKFRPW